MSDFIAKMAATSRDRVRTARAHVGEAELLRRAGAQSDPKRLQLDVSGFDVIAEFKLRSPSGDFRLADGSHNPSIRGAAYARGGACAVSVVTEPTEFAGSLASLAAMALASRLPTMRKDFLVEPYQVIEARAHGASGILLIARLLSAALLEEMLAAAAALKMFALVEAFDLDDLDRAVDALADAPGAGLLGVNARDLASLAVDGARHAVLAGRAPTGIQLVAESGIAAPTDAARVARLGYGAALVGEALMRADDPAAVLAAMISSGREAAAEREVRR